MNYNVTGVPTADICINFNRIKNYNGNVYLDAGQEFQIELFNPSSTTKLAKISINGKLISSSGLVLKPGQRVYLERYIDVPNKFKFETYKIENSLEAVVAIANNGNVKIEFFDEFVPSYYYSTGTLYHNLNNPYYEERFNNLRSSHSYTSSLVPDSIDTGRVEKGSHSEQNFTNYNGSFNLHTSSTVNIKLLPISAKPVEAKDLVSYCTECGTKNKKNSYKYCPSCGHKF